MKRWLVYPLTVLLLASLSIYALLPYLAKNLIENWLTEQGFQNPTFTIDRPGSHAFTITEIKVVKETENRTSTLVAGPIKISYDPVELIRQQTLKRIEIPIASLEIAMKRGVNTQPVETDETKLDLGLLSPDQWFDYIPSDELVIGQLSLHWHGPDQPDYELSGNIYLTRTELLSRIQAEINDVPLTRNDLILTRDNRFKLSILNNNAPVIQLMGHIALTPKDIEVDLLNSLYLDDTHSLLHFIPEIDISSIPPIYGSLSGKYRFTLPRQLTLSDTESLLSQISIQGHNRLSALINDPEKHIGSVRLDLKSSIAIQGNELNWQIHDGTKATINHVSHDAFSLGEVLVSIEQPTSLKGHIFHLNESILPFKVNLQLSANNIGQERTRYPNISASSKITVDLPMVQTQSVISAANTGLNVFLKTQTDLKKELTEAQWSIPKQNLPSLVQTLLPYLKVSIPENLQLLSGQYEHLGSLTYNKGSLKARVSHTLSNMDLAYDSALIEGLSLDSKTSLNNDQVNEAGQFTARKITSAVEFTNITGQYQLRKLTSSKPQLEVKSLSANLLSGTVRLTPFKTPLTSLDIQTDIRLKELSLQKILEIQQQPELTGQGTLRGSLPFILSNNTVTVRNGLVTAEPGGYIAYKADPNVRAMAASNTGLSLALEALENFHYQKLSAETEYKPNGDLTLNTKIEGANPDWNNGRQINFAINIEQNLLKLLQTLQIADKLTEKLEKKYGKSN